MLTKLILLTSLLIQQTNNDYTTINRYFYQTFDIKQQITSEYFHDLDSAHKCINIKLTLLDLPTESVINYTDQNQQRYVQGLICEIEN